MDTWVDIGIIVVMFVVGDRMLYCAPSIKVGFRFDDPSIQKPLLPLSVDYRVVIYGTSLAIMAILYILENLFAEEQVYRMYWKYVFGWMCIANINMFVKSFAGRLRPNFFAMNRWDRSSPHPTGFSEDHPLPEPKTSLDKMYVMESRKSFFSGHSAMGMYAACFIAIYCHQMLPRNLIVLIFQLFSLLIGMYPGLTQCMNYWHHWDDVAVGYLLGAVSAFVSYFYIIHDKTHFNNN